MPLGTGAYLIYYWIATGGISLQKPSAMEKPSRVVLYGTTWCSGTWCARRLFDEHQIPYRWVDIDQDAEAAAFVQEVNNGCRSVPTIVFVDGSIMVEPSGRALGRKLRSL